MLESGENYLETILVLEKRNGGRVRSVDLATELSFSKPSVSRAVGILKQNGYLTVEDNGNLCLTEAGRAKAEQILERHEVLTVFFQKIAGVGAELAEKDACRVEHVISNETFYGIKSYLSKLDS